MAGIATVLDLLRKNPSLTTQSLQTSGFFSTKAAASAAAAAASVAAGASYLYKSFINFKVPAAYCDAGATSSEYYTCNLLNASIKLVFQNESVNYGTKEYTIELKPLFRAFELRALTLTNMKSFLTFFLPLLEPHTKLEEDDDDSLSWIISVGIDIYRSFSEMINSKEEVDETETAQALKLLGIKILGTTIRFGASLVFASIGGVIGATLFCPSTGQWIGSALGEVAGRLIVSYCLEKFFHAEL